MLFFVSMLLSIRWTPLFRPKNYWPPIFGMEWIRKDFVMGWMIGKTVVPLQTWFIDSTQHQFYTTNRLKTFPMCALSTFFPAQSTEERFAIEITNWTHTGFSQVKSFTALQWKFYFFCEVNDSNWIDESMVAFMCV